MPDIIGQSIGKYDILEELGRGGFGAVYRVRNRDLGREEALKVLGQHRAWDPTLVPRFLREARAAARLRHPHIVTIYEVGEAEGMHFIAMEYLPGPTLAKLIADEGALPPTRVAAIVSPVADALDYAHGQGLIHRDIKPANVIVGPGDHATLTDFGLVKAADHSGLSQDLFSPAGGPTSSGLAMGTPEYMAPELAEPIERGGPAADYRADIYALGVVAYQALAGHLPFSAPTPIAVLRAHVDLAPPPLTHWNAGLPAAVSQAVLRALAKNPAERYPSAGGFAAALSEAVRQAEAERSRTERLAALYVQAEQALATKNWAAALAACGQVMALDASYRDVGGLFDQANQGLVKQRAWEAQQEEMAAQYDQGVAHLAANKWDEAIAAFEPLAKGEQVFRDADHKLADAQDARAAAEARKQAQIAVLYREALTSYQAAERCVAQILALQPDWRDPTGALDRLLNLPVASPENEAEDKVEVESRYRVETEAAPRQQSVWIVLGPTMAATALLFVIWGLAQSARPAPTPQVIEKVIQQTMVVVVEKPVEKIVLVTVLPPPATSLPPTATASATATPTPASTPTPLPAAVPTRAATPTSTSRGVILPSPTPRSVALTAPTLSEPADGSAHSGRVQFRWQPQSALPDDAYYEVVWWNLNQAPETAQGLAEATRLTSVDIDLDALYGQQRISAEGSWTVIIVQISPRYARLTLPPGNARRLTYTAPGGGEAPPPPPR